MQIEIAWLVEGYILHVHVQGDITIHDFRAMDKHLIRLLDENPRLLHIVYDNQELGHFPLQPLQIRTNQMYLHHANLGRVVLYGTNPMVKPIATVINQFSKVRLQVVDNYADALQFFKDNNIPIDWEKQSDKTILTYNSPEN